MSLISLLVFLIVFGLLFWVVRTLGASFGLPAQILQVIYVLLVVVAVLALLQAFGLLGDMPSLRVR
jgi:hypothetical protein